MDIIRTASLELLQNRTPPENLFQVDSLLEAVDQRIALNETPPPQPPSSSSVSGGAAAGPSNGVAPSSTASTSASSEATNSTAASTSPALSSASVAPRRRRFSVTGGGQQLRRFRSTPFSLARVIETAGPRLRVRLVGTDDRNDCWFLVDSDEIRPYPSHETLQPPFGYVHNHLVWNKTLRRTVEEGKAASAECFAKVCPTSHSFDGRLRSMTTFSQTIFLIISSLLSRINVMFAHSQQK